MTIRRRRDYEKAEAETSGISNKKAKIQLRDDQVIPFQGDFGTFTIGSNPIKEATGKNLSPQEQCLA